MAISIREADINADREIIVDTLLHHLNPFADRRRFDWLYPGNPFGPAKTWLAMDSSNGSVVGLASAFPRLIYGDSRELRAWVLGDFCINSQYRSLGPALQLQRSCLEAVRTAGVAFCYDFPNIGMASVYKRLQINPVGKMIRMAKPLRINDSVAKYLKNRILSRALGAAGNHLLHIRDRWGKRSDGNLAISFESGECADEFTRLAREIGDRYGMCTQRSAEYLNWRYLANTYCHHSIVTARRCGVLLAYAIISHSEDHAILADLFGFEDPWVIGCLMEELVTRLRRQNMATLSAPMFESHPWLPLLQGLGFWERETTPVMFYPAFDNGIAGGSFGNSKWFLTHGDRDS